MRAAVSTTYGPRQVVRDQRGGPAPGRGARPPAVTGFTVGDRVFGFSEDRLGPSAGCPAVPENGLVATGPENLTLEQAAPSTEVSHHALTNTRKGRIRSGQDVLVYGATGQKAGNVLTSIVPAS